MNITELLRLSVKHNVSDLHLSSKISPMVRVDGEIQKLPLPNLSEGSDLLTDNEVQELLFEVMTDEQQKEFKNNFEIDFSLSLEGMGRFRVNAFYQQNGCSAVFRHIPTETPTLDDINAPDIFRKIASYEQGLVLVTGATGSGKSTTLAAIVGYINQHHNKHILTIEDPIEFIHHSDKSLINQREVHRHTLNFNIALRSALREDPDVILVGELRDQETIKLALTAAETGHLVLATLHTNSAAKTINRIVDVFPAGDKEMVRSMLSDSLQTVIAQKLLKRCAGGRIAAYEILSVTSAVRHLIRENKIAQIYSLIQTGANVGMQTMEQHLQKLKLQGFID